MPRKFKDILAEITAKSDPQRKIVLNQISALPTQQLADEASLEAKKDLAYEDILGGARQRGLGFSGIPLAEQAKYNATDYAPAVANLKSTYGGRKATLESALADVGRSDYTTAYDIFNQDRNFAEQQRQFNEQQAAAQANPFAGLFGGNPGQGGGQQPQAAQVNSQQQNDYNFVKGLIEKVQGGDGTSVSMIIKQARDGNARSKEIMRAFYELQGMPIPANFRSFL